MRQLTIDVNGLTIFPAPRPSQAIPDRTADCPEIPCGALAAVRRRLADLAYGAPEIDSIVAYLAREGTLAGAPHIGPASEAIAEAAYVAALPVVPYSDAAAWGSDDDLDDLDLVLPLDPDGPGPELAGEDDPTGEWPPVPVEPPDEWPGSAEAGWAYQPTAEDLAAYRAMLAEDEAQARRIEAERAEALGLARVWAEIDRLAAIVDTLAPCRA